MLFKIIPLLLVFASLCPAQSIQRRSADVIPTQLETMYTRGLKYLAHSQNQDGSWADNSGKYPGVVGLSLLSFLAHGEDPNNGPYAQNIHRSLNFLLDAQQASNGYITGPPFMKICTIVSILRNYIHSTRLLIPVLQFAEE